MAFYTPSPTCKRYMLSNARRRIIMGPFRSGKSVCNIMEIVRRASQQAPGPDGLRRTRFAVVRNTMRQLVDTTIKTWLDWIPNGIAGTMRQVDKTFMMNYNDIRCEVMFRALDDAADVRNLLSLELTGAYINESREIAREIVEGLDARIGQYPKKIDGGCTWYGLFADTNPPSEGEYWQSICESVDPTTMEPTNAWEVFKQPSGLSADAENAEYLADNYYKDLAEGKTDEYVRVYIKNEYGKSKAGKPVHPQFSDSVHVAKDYLTPNPLIPLTISADFGRTPAIVFGQMDVFGRLLIFDEIVTEGMGLDRCLKELARPLLKNRFDAYDVRVTGDPSGAFGTQTDEATCVTIFKRHGFKSVKFAKSNNPIERQGALDEFLGRRPESGGILIDPRCKMIIRGLGGGYHYKIARNGIAAPEPEKNIFSHICEALQYMAMFYKQPPESKQRDIQTMRVAQAHAQMNKFAGTYAMRR